MGFMNLCKSNIVNYMYLFSIILFYFPLFSSLLYIYFAIKSPFTYLLLLNYLYFLWLTHWLSLLHEIVQGYFVISSLSHLLSLRLGIEICLFLIFDKIFGFSPMKIYIYIERERERVENLKGKTKEQPLCYTTTRIYCR